MCPPVLGALSAAATIGGQIAGHAAKNKAAEANERAANSAARMRRRDILTQKVQTRQDVIGQLFRTERQVRGARALAAVGAGEAGVAGISAQEVFDDINRDAIEFRMTTKKQEGRVISKLDRELVATEEQRRNRIASQPRSSALALGLGIAGTAINWAEFEVRQATEEPV